jgi:peroxiredoxin
LLSDPGSKTIDAYGIRNKASAGTRLDGIPHPGTILVDQAGVIRAKLFHDGYKTRHDSAALIEAARKLDAAP